MGSSAAFRRMVEAGETVFRQGDAADHAYLIEAGTVDIVVLQDGRPETVATLLPGDLLGEMALIDDQARSGTAIARTRTTLIMITRAQLSRRIEQADPVMRLCLGMLVQRLRLATADPRGHRPAMPAPSSSDGVRATLAQEQELLDAIETAAFEPFFQPVVALGAGAVVGYEALARWAHPARGILGPAAFVPLAERAGLIDRIDRQIQHRACLALASGALAAMPGGMPFLTLNLSATAFADPGFVDAMQAMLAESGADARHIKLEITESALIADPDTAARRLAACRALGFGVAIDDFGTGHASLGYLHRFPVDTIKIDRSFVQGVEQDGKRRAILASILDLAARLGLTTIAEGIETQAQRGALLELGCVYGQGYLFGRPGPCDGRLPAAADQR